MDGTANHFPARNAPDCRILHIRYQNFPGVIPPDPNNIYNATIVSAGALYSVRKFRFCKIYTVFVGNLFYKLAHKKISYAVCWKASKTVKTLISKRRTLEI